MCSTMAGPTRSSARAALLSQAAGRGAVHAGARAAAARRRSRSNCSPRPRRSSLQNELSSAHITFIDEAGAAECERRGWLIRHGIQYHWRNRGYRDFDDFLDALTSRKRKAIRKEREAARAGPRVRGAARRRDRPGRVGLDVALLPGHRLPQMGPALSHARILRPDRRAHGRPAAAVPRPARRRADRRSAQPRSARTRFYGRYWGAVEEVPFLHFELCYYQAIEWAIANGLRSVQAGAQGEHKLARGYEPVITRSAHFIADPGFRRAVEQFPRRGAAARLRPRWSGCAARCPIAPRVLVGVDRDAPTSARRRRRGTSPRVVKPQAVSPDGDTAISPPAAAKLPGCPRSTPSSAACRPSPPSRMRSASWWPATARMKYSPDPVAETAADRSSA